MTGARYRIGTLAKLTGITTHALRIWERRYAALSPKRTPGGARLYSDDDVQRLRLIKQLLDRGYTISAIARLPVSELRTLLPPDPVLQPLPAGPPSARAKALIDQIITAIAQMDLDMAGRILAQASNGFSPHDLITQVLAPVLDEIGRRWEAGQLCVASEHAASALLRTQLGALLAAQQVASDPPVICTTPSGEQHELGALLAAVVIAMHGRKAIYLGANLPAPEIAEAARLANATTVALSIVGLKPDEASRELELVCRELPPDISVVVGGRRARELPRVPERVQLLPDLPDLENWLSRKN